MIVASLTRESQIGADETLNTLSQGIEVRADLLGDPALERLRAGFHGSLFYTLRSSTIKARSERAARLRRAAHGYDLIELEAPHDLQPALLNFIPPRQRVIAWYGDAHDPAELYARFLVLSTIPARGYKLVTEARRPADALVPLVFLKRLNRSDTLAYARGQAGAWSRLLAPFFGWPLHYGRLEADVGGAPDLAGLQRDYGYPQLRRPRRLFGIVGDPVAGSLSPRLHNAAYESIGLDALYLPFETSDFDEFWHGVVQNPLFAELDLPLDGLTVVSPHKEAAPIVADAVDPVVQQAGSGNLLLRRNGLWNATTTDPHSVLTCLRNRDLDPAGRTAAVIGCGGAGRPVAAALAAAGARVTVVNRSPARGRVAQRRLDLPFVPLSRFRASDYAIVVHATPAGRDGHDLPFTLDGLHDDAILIEMVYGPGLTALAHQAAARCCVFIDGREILNLQVRDQFRAMTGRELPGP